LTTMIQRSPSPRPSRDAPRSRIQSWQTHYPPSSHPTLNHAGRSRTSQRFFHKTSANGPQEITPPSDPSHLRSRSVSQSASPRDQTPPRDIPANTFSDANYHNKLPKIVSADAAGTQCPFLLLPTELSVHPWTATQG
jgi:hypothetical protein